MSERVRKANVEAKWAALDNYQQALEDRHITPGNALNYEERYLRVKQFLQQDVRTAYLKVRCVEKAVNKLFGLSVTLLPPAASGYLDYLVFFIRDVIDKLELESMKEIDFDHIVYLHQARWIKTSGTAVKRIDDTLWNDLTGQTGSGLLLFDLSTNEFPAAVQRLRMRGLGLTCATVSPEAQVARFKSFSAVIFPPMPDDLFSPGSKKERNPIIVEGIAVAETGAAKIFNYDPITNVDPRGEWRIQISANSSYPDGTARARNSDDISRMLDLRVHLRLTGVVDNKPGSWADYSA